MTALTKETVRSLTDLALGDVPVTSCYLDVDGRRLPSHQDVAKSFEHLARRRGLLLDDRKGTGAVHPSVAEDVRKMAAFVKGFTRSNGTRSVALFSCASSGWWEVLELPVPVVPQLHVHHGPYVRPLEEVLDEYERFGLLLVDRQRARMFVYELGELRDRTEVQDLLERRGEDDRGEMNKTRVEQQREEQMQQHLRRAARLAFEVFQREGFDRFLLGASADVAPDVEKLLHPYLQERLAERVQVAASATMDQVRKAAHEAEQRVERRGEAVAVSRLRDEAARKGRAVVGLSRTLHTLNERRVETLLVSQGYTAEGWRCPSCRSLATLGRRCPVCNEEMTLLQDIVEEAVEEALHQHCRVEVCVGNADLDVLGGIGALLRF